MAETPQVYLIFILVILIGSIVLWGKQPRPIALAFGAAALMNN
jgi:hypothetical protein